MKKSQILAAIALAMALGVVAPVVSAENASAAVVEGKTNAQYVADEKDAIEAKFGTVKVYDVNGITTSYEEGYEYYGTAAGVIDAAQGVIDKAKADEVKTLAGADNTAGARKVLADAQADDLITAENVAKITENANWGKDYGKTVELVNGVKATFVAIKNEPQATTERVKAAEDAVAALEGLLKTASDNIDTAVADKATDKTVTDAIAMVKALTNETVEAPKTAAELSAIIAKINGKLPQMAAYRRVAQAFEDAKDIDIAGLTDRQVKELVAAYWAAYNGTTPDKTVDQIVDEVKPGVNAPATGIAGTAEGTATTVSIVAGLATALTALGAGVVAYRSARRK